MYKSSITAKELIDELRGEVDISLRLEDAPFLRAINTVEQFIYCEILKEYVTVAFSYNEIADNEIDLSDISVPSGASTLIFDDIVKIFADGDELEKSGASAVVDFPDKNLFYDKFDGKISLNFAYKPDEIVIIYRLRPEIKTISNENTALIYVPVEFIDLVASKVRGEIYKIANEDGLSAKWLADYNAILENFKIWAMNRNERYGG